MRKTLVIVGAAGVAGLVAVGAIATRSSEPDNGLQPVAADVDTAPEPPRITSSVVGRVGIPNYPAYSATKAAQDALATGLRAELESEGIDVTAVYPVGTKTEFTGATRETWAQLEHEPFEVGAAQS